MTIDAVVETQTPDDLVNLDRCWQEPGTFLFLPARTFVRDSWLRQAIDLVPDDLTRHHFGLLTSGSTGAPKLVIGSRARGEHLAAELHRAQDSEPVEETIVALPLSYSFAFVNQWLWSRVFSRRLVLTDGFRRPAVLSSALRRATASMLCLVGSQLPLLDALLGDEEFPGVQRLHFAGGRFPQEQLPRIRRQFPQATVFNNFGCAEALPRLTLRRAEEGESASDIGMPLNGVQLTADAEGALRFRSLYRAVALVEEGKLKRVEDDEWLPTGDLAHLGAAGHWFLDGRSGEVFKRHGEKVSAAALVTRVCSAWDGMAVTYREMDPSGEPGLVLVLSPQPEPSRLNGILRLLRDSFPRAQWPLRIEGAAEVPLLANGKPDVASVAGAPGRVVLWRQRI